MLGLTNSELFSLVIGLATGICSGVGTAMVIAYTLGKKIGTFIAKNDKDLSSCKQGIESLDERMNKIESQFVLPDGEPRYVSQIRHKEMQEGCHDVINERIDGIHKQADQRIKAIEKQVKTIVDMMVMILPKISRRGDVENLQRRLFDDDIGRKGTS
jgi:hypothetical protein